MIAFLSFDLREMKHAVNAGIWRGAIWNGPARVTLRSEGPAHQGDLVKVERGGVGLLNVKVIYRAGACGAQERSEHPVLVGLTHNVPLSPDDNRKFMVSAPGAAEILEMQEVRKEHSSWAGVMAVGVGKFRVVSDDSHGDRCAWDGLVEHFDFPQVRMRFRFDVRLGGCKEWGKVLSRAFPRRSLTPEDYSRMAELRQRLPRDFTLRSGPELKCDAQSRGLLERCEEVFNRAPYDLRLYVLYCVGMAG